MDDYGRRVYEHQQAARAELRRRRRQRAPRPTSGPAPNAQIRFHPPAYAPAGGWAFKTYKNGAGEMCAAEVVPGEGEDATCFARATLFRKTPLLAFLGSRQTGDDITQWDNAWVWGFAEKPITHVQLILTDCTIRDLPVDAEGVYADVEGPATLRAGEKFPRVHTEVKNVQYLYDAGDEVVFMDEETYDQFGVPRADVAEVLEFVQPSSSVQMLTVDGRPSGVQMPASLELTVADTEPGVKGDTVSNVTKPATLETGAVVQVPLFVNVGDRIKVDTRERRYISRA